MKQIDLSKLNKKEIEAVNKEAHLLSVLNNEYVVKYYESFCQKNQLCIIMEYCENGDLYNFLKSRSKLLEEDVIWRFFIEICLGIEYLHRKKILHRDLKSLNLFLSEKYRIKIGDLGVAKQMDSDSFAKTLVGTPYYLSPEICEEKPYNDKSDIWALGCILYELATFKHPFQGKSQAALILNIINAKFNPIQKNYSNELSKIISILLNKNHFKRPSIHQILNFPSTYNLLISSY